MKPLVILGVGHVGGVLAARLAGTRPPRKLIGSTRRPEAMLELMDSGLEPLIIPWLSDAAGEIIESAAAGADVVVTFPPDGSSDEIYARGCRAARRIVYVSATSVYGSQATRVDHTTPASPDSDKARLRLAAEDIWRAVGAIVVRAPGIYSAKSGLHLRLKAGTYKIPGDGSGVISRIHCEDLVTIILAALERAPCGSTYVCADACAVPQIEVVEWLCHQMQLPMPPQADLAEVSPTLRGNRSVDGSAVLADLGVTLKYPSFKEGFLPLIQT